jgi:hypothetical protein
MACYPQIDGRDARDCGILEVRASSEIRGCFSYQATMASLDQIVALGGQIAQDAHADGAGRGPRPTSGGRSTQLGIRALWRHNLLTRRYLQSRNAPSLGGESRPEISPVERFQARTGGAPGSRARPVLVERARCRRGALRIERQSLQDVPKKERSELGSPRGVRAALKSVQRRDFKLERTRPRLSAARGAPSLSETRRT